MVQIVAQAADQQRQPLNVVEVPAQPAHGQHGERGLAHVEGVAPVVVLDRAVVTLDRRQPLAEHL